ncbi:MAG: TraR/DksA family transcriptional regulator [Simkaniaceae bacterium]|nr:TraR/DksA family transcriptional regulator [Simkaniaceae bacterium]
MGLTKSQIAELKARLEQLRLQLTHNVQVASKDVKDAEGHKGYSQHQADEGTDDFDRSVSIELTFQECEVLRQVERALEKVEEGSYGICDITNEEIPIKRLEAIPYATMTVAAQSKLEKEKNLF